MNQTKSLLQLSGHFENKWCSDLVKTARIRHLSSGKWRVLSQEGKSLGTYDTKHEAVKRLRQVEYYKHHDKDDVKDKPVIDLTDIDEFAYSAIMRKLRQNAKPEQATAFLKLFKSYFDQAVKADKHSPEKIALQHAIIALSKKYKVKLNKDMIKSAAVASLGNADQVGKYLSDIVKFIIAKIPLEKQPHALEVLKQKFSTMSENEIASKHLPQAAIYGQAITFVKHVLFNQDATYVRGVLNSLSRNL